MLNFCESVLHKIALNTDETFHNFTNLSSSVESENVLPPFLSGPFPFSVWACAVIPCV